MFLSLQVVEGHGPPRQADEALRTFRVGFCEDETSRGDSPESNKHTPTHSSSPQARRNHKPSCKYGNEKEKQDLNI